MGQDQQGQKLELRKAALQAGYTQTSALKTQQCCSTSSGRCGPADPALELGAQMLMTRHHPCSWKLLRWRGN